MTPNAIFRLYARVGPILGAIYLYLLTLILVLTSIVGIHVAPAGPQLHALWLTLFAGFAMLLCGNALLRGRTFASLITYVAAIVVLCLLVDRAHAAFSGYGDATFDIPSWPPILLNVLIASAVGGAAILEMLADRTAQPFLFSSLVSNWTLRLRWLWLAIILVAAFEPDLLAHQYSWSAIVGTWGITIGSHNQVVSFGADGSYTVLNDDEVAMRGQWVRDGLSAANVTINHITAHYALSPGDQLCFSTPDAPSACYQRIKPQITSQPMPAPNPQVTINRSAPQAVDAVRQYYRLWDQGDFRSMYTMLSPRMQAKLPFDTYVKYHSLVTQIETDAEPGNAANVVLVRILSHDRETDGSISQTTNVGQWTLIWDDGTWKLDSEDVREVKPSNDPRAAAPSLQPASTADLTNITITKDKAAATAATVGHDAIMDALASSSIAVRQCRFVNGEPALCASVRSAPDVQGFVSDTAQVGLIRGRRVMIVDLSSGGSMGIPAALVFINQSFAGYINSPSGHLSVTFTGGGLKIVMPLYQAGDAQCCPSRYRYQFLTLNGGEFVKLREWVAR